MGGQLCPLVPHVVVFVMDLCRVRVLWIYRKISIFVFSCWIPSVQIHHVESQSISLLFELILPPNISVSILSLCSLNHSSQKLWLTQTSLFCLDFILYQSPRHLTSICFEHRLYATQRMTKT